MRRSATHLPDGIEVVPEALEHLPHPELAEAPLGTRLLLALAIDAGGGRRRC